MNGDFRGHDKQQTQLCDEKNCLMQCAVHVYVLGFCTFSANYLINNLVIFYIYANFYTSMCKYALYNNGGKFNEKYTS